MNKYELLTNDFQLLSSGSKIYRIKALKSFGKVKKGDLGGYISSENNLSQTGNSWVYGNALVYGNAQIFGNTLVSGNSIIFKYIDISI